MTHTIQNLSIDVLLDAYTQQTLDPLALVLSLREQALAQSDFNAWITLLSDAQLQVYCDKLKGESPQTRPLFGIPFAIKDNIDLANVPTTAGCEAYTYTPEKSSVVVDLLIKAGAIPLGKTNLDQFATGLVGTRSPFGEGKNVFNPDYISGGSSAGSAISTALGQVSFALGTDTAGSGRVPAVLNNLIGHKPTKGLLSTTGVVPACKTLDCVSIFTLNSRDAATVLSVAGQYDQSDAYSRPNTPHNNARFAHVPASFTFGVPAQCDFCGNSETQALFEQAITQLESLGGKKISIDFAPFTAAAKLLYEGPWVAERWLATQDVSLDNMLPEIRTIIGNGNHAKASDAFAAQYALSALKKQCDTAVNSVDIMMAPTTPTFFTREQIAQDPIKNNSILGTYTNFMNLLDYAGTAVPIGATKSGVHWGVTLFSHAHTDYTLLSFAQKIEQQRNAKMGATPYSAFASIIDAVPTNAPKTPAEHTEKNAIPSPSYSMHRINTTPCAPYKKQLEVVVCGAHLAGQPLNWQLTERGGTLVQSTTTSQHYALYVLPDNKRPALVREPQGSAIAVQVWSLPAEYYGAFVEAIPAPLGIGKVELASGQWVSGFICDSYALNKTELTNITELGGWEAWLAQS